MLCDSSLNNNSNLYSIRTAVSKKMISSYIFQEESACSKLMIEQQLDDNYNSFIDISNIIHDTKRKLKSYSLYDIDSNRKKNNRNRDYDNSYDNLRAMKRSKTCADFTSFKMHHDDNVILDNVDCTTNELKSEVKMISDLFNKCISIP